MKYLSNVKPGDVVVTYFGLYWHLSLVSDTIDKTGKYKLISATKRTGTVREEDWDSVTQGHRTVIADIKSNYSGQEVIAIARSQIGIWSYSILNNNCEHFIKWVNGLEVTSTQVTSGVLGAMAGSTLVKTYSKDPTFFELLTGALVVGGASVALTRIVENKTETKF